MNQKRRNTQGANRPLRYGINIFIVVVNKPENIPIRLEVYTAVIQCGNTGQNHGRTIRLDHIPADISINITEEQAHGNLLVCIVPGKIYADKGYKADFR